MTREGPAETPTLDITQAREAEGRKHPSTFYPPSLHARRLPFVAERRDANVEAVAEHLQVVPEVRRATHRQHRQTLGAQVPASLRSPSEHPRVTVHRSS